MGDIVERLKLFADSDVDETARDGTLAANDIRQWGFLLREAADEIERLRALVQGIITAADSDAASGGEMFWAEVVGAEVERVRAALPLPPKAGEGQ